MTRENRDALRKAAILITSLDAASADSLLDQMDAEQAARVRDAVMELGEIDPVEQQQVIQEFVNRSPTTTPVAAEGVELDPSLARLIDSPSSNHPDLIADAVTAAAPFESLHDIEAQTLAGMLIREHPQTIAIVIAHLPPERAADLLALLPARLQTGVLTRVARLGQPDPNVLRDIELEMKSMLSNRDTDAQRGVRGVAAVTAILNAIGVQQRQQLIASLAEQDTVLATHLAMSSSVGPQSASAEHAVAPGFPRDVASRTHAATPVGEVAEARSSPPASANADHAASDYIRMTFADLERLDDSTLAHVLRTADSNTTLLALAGASHAFMQRILRHFPPREAGRLERQMQQLGPLRLDDIERAQRRLAAIAQQLVGELSSPELPGQKFTVAA